MAPARERRRSSSWAASTWTWSPASSGCPPRARRSPPAASPATPAARAPTRRSPPPGSAPRCRWWARSARDPFADEALALLRDGGVDLGRVVTVDDRPTGHRADPGRRRRRDHDRRRRRRQRGGDGARRARPPTSCSPSSRCPTRPSPRPWRCPGSPCSTPPRPARSPADVLRTVDLLSVNADEHAVLGRTADLDALPAVVVTRGAAGAVAAAVRARGRAPRRRRRSTPSTAPLPATRSPPRSPSRWSGVSTTRPRCGGRARSAR